MYEMNNGEMGIGLQLYTLRDDMEANFEETLRQVASLGYQGVEFAGYYGKSAEEIRDLLVKLNLTTIGSHVGFTRLRDNLDQEIEFLKIIGGKFIICPGIPAENRKTAEDWKQLFVFFEDIGSKVREQGLQFGYHNHWFEFDIQVDNHFAYDALFAATTSEAVQVEMDVCWIQYAGQDPLAYIKKYSGRIPLLHLKDYTVDEQNNRQTLELGQGQVQLKEVVAAAAEAGVKWLIIEQDQCQNPPLVSVANSLTWLINHNLVKK